MELLSDYGQKKQTKKNWCWTKELGDCVFYRCDKRQSKIDWIDHHKKKHGKDDFFFVYANCDDCKRLHDEETHFMEGCIKELERKLSSPVDNATNSENTKNSSGYREPIEMPNEALSAIEATVEADLDSHFAEEEEYFEGNKIRRYTYERNPKLRSKAILLHGYECKVCGFDFQEKYGERGSEFIEVHHLNPVSSHEKDTSVDPKTEMTVVCSNCHRMIHRKKDQILSPDELRELIRQNQKGLGK
jgi:predicted restriction endonuclease